MAGVVTIESHDVASSKREERVVDGNRVREKAPPISLVLIGGSVSEGGQLKTASCKGEASHVDHSTSATRLIDIIYYRLKQPSNWPPVQYAAARSTAWRDDASQLPD